ncbi:TIGR02569 family protein [Pseudonocardiaceae bacterium YIM PH 21723]|nr:TIGR02569 family protein [Pseudonocardiaceae bacterium YIM PH 21723]
MRAGFGARDIEPEPVDGSNSWRCGDILLKPVSDTAEAAWVASTLDGLRTGNLRIARPLRTTDGRWVLGGWTASRYVAGRPEPRHDAVIAASLRLHASTARLPRPRFLDGRQDVLAVADRVAWQEQELSIESELFGELSELAEPTRLRAQVVHGDLFGNVLFAGSAPPAIVDFVPFFRPPEWAAAVIAVDALAWGDADLGLIRRWAHLSSWPQMLLRALLFRIATVALHPDSTEESLAGLHKAADLIAS